MMRDMGLGTESTTTPSVSVNSGVSLLSSDLRPGTSNLMKSIEEEPYFSNPGRRAELDAFYRQARDRGFRPERPDTQTPFIDVLNRVTNPNPVLAIEDRDQFAERETVYNSIISDRFSQAGPFQTDAQARFTSPIKSTLPSLPRSAERDSTLEGSMYSRWSAIPLELGADQQPISMFSTIQPDSTTDNESVRVLYDSDGRRPAPDFEMEPQPGSEDSTRRWERQPDSTVASSRRWERQPDSTIPDSASSSRTPPDSTVDERTVALYSREYYSDDEPALPQQAAIATVAAGFSWKSWTFVAIGVGLVVFTATDIDSLGTDIDHTNYATKIVTTTKNVLKQIYKKGSQLATDISTINASDMQSFQAVSLIVGSLMITWGFCERRIVSMLNTGNFRHVGGILAYNPRALMGPSAGFWGRAILITPNLMHKVLSYWKSPHMASWLQGNEFIKQILPEELLDGLQNSQQAEWATEFDELLWGTDAALASWEVIVTMNNGYSHWFLSTMLHFVFLRPYSYGLYNYGKKIHDEFYALGPSKYEKATAQVKSEYDELFNLLFYVSQPTIAPTIAPTPTTKPVIGTWIRGETKKPPKKQASGSGGIIILAIAACIYLFSK